jgi:hypothetical protein
MPVPPANKSKVRRSASLSSKRADAHFTDLKIELGYGKYLSIGVMPMRAFVYLNPKIT